MNETIEYGEDYISIANRAGDTLVYWHMDEWTEDPQVAFSIFHAIELATCNDLEYFMQEGGLI